MNPGNSESMQIKEEPMEHYISLQESSCLQGAIDPLGIECIKVEQCDPELSSQSLQPIIQEEAEFPGQNNTSREKTTPVQMIPGTSVSMQMKEEPMNYDGPPEESSSRTETWTFIEFEDNKEEPSSSLREPVIEKEAAVQKQNDETMILPSTSDEMRTSVKLEPKDEFDDLGIWMNEPIHSNGKKAECTEPRKTVEKRKIENDKGDFSPLIEKMSKNLKKIFTTDTDSRESHFLKKERPHKCSVCEKTFAYAALFKLHLLVHTTEKPLECSVCKKTFPDEPLLKKHMLIHSEENPYTCSVCTIGFSDLSLLNKHMVIHIPEMPKACSFCERTFANEMLMRNHMLIHAGEKKLVRGIPEKTLTDESSVDEHMLIHTDEKAHKGSIGWENLTNQLSNSAIVDMILIYGQFNRNSVRAADEYAARYPDRIHPREDVFRHLEQQIRLHGKLQPLKQPDGSSMEEQVLVHTGKKSHESNIIQKGGTTRFSYDEIFDMMLIYGQCNGNTRRSAATYAAQYPDRLPPRADSFHNLKKRMCAHGILHPPKRPVDYASLVELDTACTPSLHSTFFEQEAPDPVSSGATALPNPATKKRLFSDSELIVSVKNHPEPLSHEFFTSASHDVSSFSCTVEHNSGICEDEGHVEQPLNAEDANDAKQQLGNDSPPEELTRKRSINAAKWRANVAKRALNKGEEHFNVNNKLVKAKEIQPSCAPVCRFKCWTKVSEEDRREIFDLFWKKLPDKTRKWDFIGRHVKSTDINLDNNSRKKSSRQYYFRINGILVKICKTMFLSTLDICDGWVKTAMKKIGSGGRISPDKRGRNSKRPHAISKEVKSSVKDHINAFPRMDVHYFGANSSKEYLRDDIQSVLKMYELYLESVGESDNFSNCFKPASERQYRDIFNTEFNISFFSPKKDQCDLCTQWKNALEDNRQDLRATYEEHIVNKDIAQALRDRDTRLARKTENKTLCVICFGYQKTLSCPQARASVFYYKKKLGVSNFTIADVGKHESNCYVYDDSVANRGSNEVSSCLYHFIERKVQEGITEFRCYGDNCPSQNQNRVLAAMFAHAAVKFNVCITHTFLEKGHTYNAVDTVHSLIERNTKPYEIFTPAQWYDKIRTAKRCKTNPLKVIEVDQNMVYDFKDLMAKLNLIKNTTGENVPWTGLRQVRADGSTPHQVTYKIELTEGELTVSTKKVGHPVNLTFYKPEKAYTSPLPIDFDTHTDLMFYCEKKLIPAIDHPFYFTLTHTAPEAKNTKQNPDTNQLVPENPAAVEKCKALQTVARSKTKRKKDLPEDADDPD